MTPGFLIRRALGVTQRRARFSRVVIVNGPRQSGKTVLLRMLHESTGGSWNLLDDAKALLAARRDAAGFVRESERPLFVDKVQRAGNPFILAVKAAVDLVDTPGQFYLAGRIQFAGFESLLVPKSISAQNESRHATMERVCRGEMPQAIRLAGRDRREFLGSYARTAEIEPNDSTNGSSLSRSQPFGRCDPDG